MKIHILGGFIMWIESVCNSYLKERVRPKTKLHFICPWDHDFMFKNNKWRYNNLDEFKNKSDLFTLIIYWLYILVRLTPKEKISEISMERLISTKMLDGRRIINHEYSFKCDSYDKEKDQIHITRIDTGHNFKYCTDVKYGIETLFHYIYLNQYKKLTINNTGIMIDFINEKNSKSIKDIKRCNYLIKKYFNYFGITQIDISYLPGENNNDFYKTDIYLSPKTLINSQFNNCHLSVNKMIEYFEITPISKLDNIINMNESEYNTTLYQDLIISNIKSKEECQLLISKFLNEKYKNNENASKLLKILFKIEKNFD